MNSLASTAAGTEPAETAELSLELIERHQIVEKYLSGTLPVRGALDFERFCGRHPELLDALGLPARMTSALRLLEAAGKPAPWQPPTARYYEKPRNFFTLAAVALVLLATTWHYAARTVSAQSEAARLTRQLAERPLLPTATTRPVLLQPNRTAPSGQPQVRLDGASAELVDLRLDVSWSAFTNFRVLIDRVGQGRFAILGSLARDSNGQLRLGLNSSALGPGEYQIALEGLDWRGTPQAQGWVTLEVVR
jgi:hypothetical protein